MSGLPVGGWADGWMSDGGWAGGKIERTDPSRT